MSADTSSEKKLKQSRLPFSPVDPKTQKKRKLSAESEIRSPKLLCAGSSSTSKRSDEIKTEKSNAETFDKNVSKTIEEKENIKTKVLDPQFLGGEESNDSIEIVAVKGNVKESEKKAPALDSKSPEQQDKISAPKGKIKRKRSSSVKAAASSNTIKKMFKEVEVKQVVSPAAKVAKVERENEPDSEKLELKGKKTDKPLKDKDGMICKDENLENKNESIKDTNTSIISLTSDEEGSIKVESEKDSNTNTTNSSPSPLEADSETEKIKTMTVKTPVPKKAVTCMKKLTPKQNQQRELSMKKKEEMVKLKLEKEKLKKEKEVEKQIQKEERQKKKIEEQEAKEKEKEEKKQKKEEERLKKEEERLKKEEERLKKEEEKQKKEEERQRKEEEKLQAEKEEKEKRKKLQKKFAQFFVPKKVEETSSQKETVVSPDNFVHFRVKENMKIAPLVRTTLSNEKKRKLEDYLIGESEEETVNYLKEIKKPDYICEKSCRTFPPPDENNDEDDCEIISDEEIDGTDVLEVKSSQTQTIRAKLLQFCENSRPAYYGTWSKKPKNLSGRKPLAKEEIFDYDYDSDEDWEDLENGESLSDSDGEGDDGGKDEGNQYEVDNDFFVPHGYLSEGEGEEDEETEAVQKEGEEEKEKQDEDMQKEKLKQKQEEFELEMKQQTRHLKPKVFGCVWLGDKSSHQAYDQLLKLLLPHRSIVMFGTCPIDVSSKINNQELKDDEDDDETTKKFVKSFPESAVPDLIRLIHGNRHSKLFLMREFHEYWKNKREEVETDPSNSGWIALRKIEPKIQEIGQYGRFTENGISYKCRTWYVSKEVREKYGMEDLSFQNSWTYTLPVKENKREDPKEDKQDDQNEEQGSKMQLKSPFTGTNLITKFTKVVTDEEEKRKNFSVGCQSPSISDMQSPDVKTPKATSSAGKTPKATSNAVRTPKATSKAVKTSKATSNAAKTPKATSSTNKTPKAISSTGKTPRPSSATRNLLSTPLSSGKKTKSRTNLDAVIKEKTETTKPKNSIMAMFKNMEKGKKGAGNTSTQDIKNDEDPGCITLD